MDLSDNSISLMICSTAILLQYREEPKNERSRIFIKRIVMFVIPNISKSGLAIPITKEKTAALNNWKNVDRLLSGTNLSC